MTAPGSKWLRGHHNRPGAARYRFSLNSLVAKNERIKMNSARVADPKDGLGGIATMLEKTARWDDEWAVVGEQALRDTAEVMDILGRYGRVEVSYASHRPPDALEELDMAVETTCIERKLERIRAAFQEVGFSNLTIDEVKYAYINDYETVEDYAA